MLKSLKLALLLTALSGPTLLSPAQAQTPTPTPLHTDPRWKDLAPDHWVRPVLEELADKYGVKLERSNGRFEPAATLTRAEMAAVALKILEIMEQREAVPTADREKLASLIHELEPEVEDLQNRVTELEDQTDLLAARHFDLQEEFEHFQQSMPFRIFGSVALRTCSMMETNQYQVLGNTFQVRLGAGLRGQASPGWDYGVRLLTTDNQSYNLSWYPSGGNHIPRAPLNLDRFFVRWSPLKASKPGQTGLNFTVGKALNFLPETQLLYDEDVSFTGLQEELSWKDLLPGWKDLKLQLGQHILLIEKTFLTSTLLAGKVSSDWDWGDWSLRSAVSYEHYLDSDALAPYEFAQGYLGSFSSRNRVSDDNQGFVSAFHLLNGFSALEWHGIPELPVQIRGDLVRNFGATDQNLGWLVGLRLGHLQRVGNWAFDYSFRRMEQDYNLSLMTDDFYAGTDVAGQTFALSGRVADKTFVRFSVVDRMPISHPENGNLWILYSTLRQDF